MDGINHTSINIALIAEDRAIYLQRGYSEADCAALPHEGEFQAVSGALERLGHRVTHISGIKPLVKQLAAGQHKNWDVAFNMSQGFYGPSREAHVPALLEAYNIEHTFSDAATMALCQNKANAKIILDQHGIPTAPFVVIPAEEDPRSAASLAGDALLRYPLFVKPVTEGSSKGIESFNKASSPGELGMAVQALRARHPGQDILVEPFLSGREFTVSILGTGAAGRVIGVREHTWQRREDYVDRESKCSAGLTLLYNDDHDMQDEHVKAACRVALDAWAVFPCRDAGRVDVRFASDAPDSGPNVLEVNPIGGLLPHHSPLPCCAQQNGISFETLMAAILDSALKRKFQKGE